ncbi:MAG TPA: hypothetical protein VMY76_07950 [Gemmatimonadales bacterium]|nr:hypothetical protein [Gemmatimonadales bacterium]
MLTPAEEQGLAGLALASRVQHALYRLAPADLAALIERLRAGALSRHVVYLHEGTVEPIRILPAPITVLPDQLAYVHHVTLTVQQALKRLPSLYLHDFTVREILRLPDAEERWLRECWGPSQEAHNPVFGRLDALIDFTSPMWRDTLRFVEPNMMGIGGLHMVPTCEQLIADIVVPVLQAGDGELELAVGHDMRELLTRELLAHMAAIGSGPQVCFIEPKYAGNGPDEQEQLARYLRERHGLTVMHADPSELELRGGVVWHQGQRVDLAYRDYGVVDLLDLEEEGVDVEPMRVLLRENRVISSITADLDQKACWEVLTDPRLCQQYFTSEERQLFQRHILWTRVLSDRRTMLPDGRVGNLLDFARANHESLVLKPNRAYGGDGIVIGPAVSRDAWDVAMMAALGDPDDRWVVQQLATIPVREFPVIGPDGGVHIEPFYTVMGFAASEDGVAILARASQKQVVNVAQHGGICGVLVSRSRPMVGAVTELH